MAPRPDHALGAFIREQRELAGSSLRKLAAEAGISNPYLSQVERGLRKPSAEILQQIAKGLRISAETLYVRAGILDEVGDDRSAEAAILADHRLTERQKRVLLDICASFRRENAEIAAEPPSTSGAKRPPTTKSPRSAPPQAAKATTKVPGASRARKTA
jgi:transcriptional regulator with XRE-family HTH domain